MYRPPSKRHPRRALASLSALCSTLALVAGCSQSVASAQSTRVTVQATGGGEQANWVGGSPIRTRIVVGEDGQTYVGVWVDAPETVAGQAVQRAPMALSLVIDTSGSMSGAKIENARIAAASMLETLVDGDIVSIYAFSSGVVEIAPPTVVGPNTRASLMQRSQGLYASGGTNLYGGVATGIQRVSSAPATHPVRRVVLISDGHANVGPSDPNSLGDLAANGTEYSVQISGIGVGLGYDEITLGALAVRSSGRLYHLEAAHQMAQILEREMQLLATTVATNAVIEIVPAPGVRILDGVTTGASVVNGRLRIPLGSVFAGQKREVLFRAQVDTSRPGSRDLGTATFVFEEPSASEPRRQQAALRYEVVRNAQAARASAAPRVQTMVSNFTAAEAQRQAAVALNNNDRASAEQHYARAEEALVAAQESAPAAEREVQQQRLQTVRSTRARARRAASPAAARSVALDSYDMAMEVEGY